MTCIDESLIGKFFVTVDNGVGDTHLIYFYRVVGVTRCGVRLIPVENNVIDRLGNVGFYDEIRIVVPSSKPKKVRDYTTQTFVEPKSFVRKIRNIELGGETYSTVKINEYLTGFIWKNNPMEDWNFH